MCIRDRYYEGQHGEGELVAEKVFERADGGFRHAREALLMGMRGVGLARALRLCGDERGGGADQHQRGHRDIAPVPGRLLVEAVGMDLSLIHISEPTRLGMISYAVFCL